MQIKFQYYSNNIESTRPLGFVLLEHFIESQKNPKDEVIEVFKLISFAEEWGDMELKAELKQNNLFIFTPCVIVKSRRKYSNIKSFTGLLILDFDHIDNAEELKEHLFNEYKFIVATWLSPSKKGLKAIVRIPVVDSVEAFKRHYYAISDIMDCYDGFDTCNKNSVLPLFQSYDPNLLYRNNATVFTEQKENETEYDYTPTPIDFVETTDKDKKSVFNILRAGMEKITTNGHPQMRSVALAAGGYVASGYVSFDEAEQFIYSLIETNSYLRKGIRGYKGTATWAIKQGTKVQLKLR